MKPDNSPHSAFAPSGHPSHPYVAKLPHAADLLGVSLTKLRAWLKDPACTIVLGRDGDGRGHRVVHMASLYEYADLVFFSQEVRLCD